MFCPSKMAQFMERLQKVILFTVRAAMVLLEGQGATPGLMCGSAHLKRGAKIVINRSQHTPRFQVQHPAGENIHQLEAWAIIVLSAMELT
ncbi:MAG: hypothetical protein A2076_15010 [Geobacteraceae bacterium GWC2_53_11]|nr:MAG: hypothetical protein A2076_15010 [Geobacteraceae bacterium GWC2_53_11]